MPGCEFCERLSDRGSIRSRIVFEDESFLVFHSEAPEGGSYLGSLLLQTKSHRVHLGELPLSDARELGELLARVSGALVRVTGASWTYCTAFTEAFRHLHMMIIARYPAMPREFVRLAYGDWPDAPRGNSAEVRTLAARLKAELETPGRT